jgi:hypothetical protein
VTTHDDATAGRLGTGTLLAYAGPAVAWGAMAPAAAAALPS